MVSLKVIAMLRALKSFIVVDVNNTYHLEWLVIDAAGAGKLPNPTGSAEPSNATQQTSIFGSSEEILGFGVYTEAAQDLSYSWHPRISFLHYHTTPSHCNCIPSGSQESSLSIGPSVLGSNVRENLIVIREAGRMRRGLLDFWYGVEPFSTPQGC